jgi:hypothetical protein
MTIIRGEVAGELERAYPAMRLVRHARVQTIHAPYRRYHELRRGLKDMRDAGEIRQAWGLELVLMGGQHMWRVQVERIAEPKSKVPARTAVAGAALFLVVAICAMLWHARWVLLAGAAIIAGVLLLAALLSGHRVGCPGIHCSGCKG